MTNRIMDMRLVQLFALLAAITQLPGDMAFSFFGLAASTWAAIAGITSAVGAGYGAYQTYQTRQQQAEQAEEMAEYNAQVAENKAEQQRMNQIAKEQRQREQKRRRLAAMEAAYAKSGVLTTGTPSQYLQEQAATTEQEIQQGKLEASQQRTMMRRKGNLAYQQGMALSETRGQQATTAAVAGGLSAAGQLAGGLRQSQNMKINPDGLGPSSLGPEANPAESLNAYENTTNTLVG